MALKPKTTKEAAPKTAKVASTTAAPVKKGAAKAKEPVVASEEITKPAKLKVATKPELQAQAAAPAVVEQSVPQPSEMLQDQKWQEIRILLEKLKEDTLREIRKSVKNGTEATAAIEPGGDIYDQASSERDRELGLLLGDREREKIHSIDEALLRISEGDYGICEECDEDIPLGRLKAMPFTRHCVRCKSDLEKLQAQTKRVEEERAYREIPLGSEEEES